MAKGNLTIADLVYRLGFENEDQFVSSLEGILKKAETTTEQGGEEAGKKGGRAAGKGFNDQFKATFGGAALGSFVGTALSQAFQGALYHASRFVQDSVKEFAVYEQGLLQLSLAGEKNLGALSKRIQDVAKASRVFSATDISLAVGDLVKAGYDAETAFALVETGVLGAASEVDAATGKFGDLSTTAGQLGNILRALGYDTSQAGRVMDVMARAAQDSNLDVSDLVDIIARVGPTAKLAGLEIEDLAAQAAVLSNNGMDASLIGTGLRSVLQSLINPSGQLKGQLDALGVSLVDGQGNLRDFNEVLDGLHELTQRGGEGLQILTQATGSYGSTAAASLGSASETVKEFRTNMENAEGSAEQLANTMRNSGAGAAAEFEARLADARAELGEQMMPHLLALNETVLPTLVGLLGQVIGLWGDWHFIITGTTTAIQQNNEALQQQLVAGLGPELAQALNDLMDARQAVADLEQKIANLSPLEFGARARFQRELDDALALRDAAQERYDLLVRQRHLAQQHQDNLANWTVPGQFGPQLPGDAGPAAAEVEQLVAAYRNLQAIEEELAAARQQHAAATSAAEEERWAAEVRRLEAEREARLATLKTTQAAARAAGSTRDPLVEEAQRVQNDLQRLKLAYEQGTLSREDYVAAQEAHVRRLDGLYDRATSPEQSLAVLRARKAFLDELARLEEQSVKELDAIRAVNRDREEEQRYPRTLTGANLRARLRADAQEEARLLQEHYDQVIRPELEKIADDRAALEAGERPSSIDSAAVAQNVRARQRAREAEAERQAEEARQEAIAEARERNNQRVLAELIEQETAYTAWLEQEAQRRADREAEIAAGRAFRQSREGIRHSLDNLFPGYATAAGQYVTLTERAEGVTVRLAQAQRTLGVATRDDVKAALEGQIAAIGRLLGITEEGSERYYELVAALEEARAALAALNAEVPDMRMPVLGSPEDIRRAQRETEAAIAQIQAQIAAGPDSVTLALLEQRLAFLRELLRQLGVAVADLDAAAAAGAEGEELQARAEQLAGDLMNVAKQFPLTIVEGVRSGDLAAALEGALGSAADFFLDQMLNAILGPITEQLTASIAQSLAAQQAQSAAGSAAGGAGALGALGPWGMVLGGLLVAGSLISAGQRRQQAAERRDSSVRSTVSSAPSVQYNLSATVNVEPGASFGDPAWEARMRAFVEQVATDLQKRVPRIK